MRDSKRAEEIREFVLKNVEVHPRDIVAIAAKEFDVTPMSVHRHINTLVKSNKIHKFGKTNNVTYVLVSSFNKDLTYKLSPELSESEIWVKEFNPLEKEIPQNVYDICRYGVTEMTNNAIDHSGGSSVKIVLQKKGEVLEFKVFDDGIGIFRKISEAIGVSDIREAVLHLTKGKFTTDPKRHSGEGIFFSSRVFDSFAISANGFFYLRNNTEDDWYLEKSRDQREKGTLFVMKISLSSKRDSTEVFKQYEDPETKAFSKTHILVDLSRSNEESFISRSQAKRILMGIEKFKHIILDFKDVRSVGQAFVDEVFRVFKSNHPDVKIDTMNTNPEIDFMITRGLATAQMNQPS